MLSTGVSNCCVSRKCAFDIVVMSVIIIGMRLIDSLTPNCFKALVKANVDTGYQTKADITIISHIKEYSREVLSKVNTMQLRQNGRYFAEIILNLFSWMKVVFSFILYWSLFPRVQLIINQHWFRNWFDDNIGDKPLHEPMMTKIYGVTWQVSDYNTTAILVLCGE